jgi:hypothetical protein
MMIKQKIKFNTQNDNDPLVVAYKKNLTKVKVPRKDSSDYELEILKSAVKVLENRTKVQDETIVGLIDKINQMTLSNTQ